MGKYPQALRKPMVTAADAAPGEPAFRSARRTVQRARVAGRFKQKYVAFVTLHVERGTGHLATFENFEECIEFFLGDDLPTAAWRKFMSGERSMPADVIPAIDAALREAGAELSIGETCVIRREVVGGRTILQVEFEAPLALDAEVA